jgi:polar amino acid transport system substrate-binding protein
MVIPLFFSTALYAETVIRITNGEWEPYHSEYSYKHGLNSHIVSEAFKLEGISIKWGFFPWKRSYKNAQSCKDWDASATWWPADNIKEEFLLSTPLADTSYVFFHLKSYKFQWESIKDLKELKVGFTRGYDYGDELMNAMANEEITIDIANKDELNFKKILMDRIHIFPNDPIVGYAQLRNIFSPDKVKLFTHHPKEFAKTTLHLIVSRQCKNSGIYMDKFNSGLKKLKESGKLDLMKKDFIAGKYDKQKVKWKE